MSAAEEEILTPEQHNVMVDLHLLGDRRRDLRSRQAELALRMNPTILEALRLGWGPSDISRATGMSRQAIYKLEAEAKRS